MSIVSGSQTGDGALLEALLEPCLAPDTNSTAFVALGRGIKQFIDAGRLEEAAAVLRKATLPTRDYTSMQSLWRMYKRLRGKVAPSAHHLRLAVLASFTSTNLVEMVELFLFAGGVDLALYEADYGVMRQEILDAGSALYEFKPKTVFIATTWRDLTHLPAINEDAAAVNQKAAAEHGQWLALWRTLHDRLGCQVVQNNFDRPAWRQLGNHEMRYSASMGRFVEHVNHSLAESAPPFVTIHDLDALAAEVGRRTWNDERYFQHAKLPCAPECLVEYAHSVASVLLAQMGLSKKCLVLDLDNTLWGGVIGDDELGGIHLGQGDSEGESFLAFQKYCLKLRQRGVILAVCSKNTDSIAREAFEKHPEMALRLSDISCFTANWNDKAANIRTIAQQLNIGINSLVFIDDNPAERSIIRRLVSEVTVPEVSTDPLDFIRAIEQGRYFQVVGLGNEDLQRTEMYQANAERQAIETSAENLDEFLKSLQMVAKIGPITDFTLERSTQLINKSNQFNLTTIRRTTAEVMAIAKNPDWITLTVSLADRFGDNGLISVLLAKVNGDVLEIDTWLMSCRVLKRNVEHTLLNLLCTEAKKRRVKMVRGKYIPTAKNALVKDHYPTLGFQSIGVSPDGVCAYELKLAGRDPFETFIDVKEAS